MNETTSKMRKYVHLLHDGGLNYYGAVRTEPVGDDMYDEYGMSLISDSPIKGTSSNAALIARSRAIDAANRMGLPYRE